MNCTACKPITKEIILTRGRTAMHGCEQGTVRVVMDPQDSDHIVNGEILVTPMTDPESVPAMKRATAVVTDRGGMLCHAAIVCREMKKPCIVGTTNATKVLKNGMLVRVCATRGLILETNPEP